MRKLSVLILAGFVALGLVAGSAWAAHHEGGEGEAKGHHRKMHHEQMFKKKDADGNGEVTREEWMASSEARFADMDADGNGSVSQDEWKSAHKRMMERRMKMKEGMMEQGMKKKEMMGQ